MSLGRMVKDAVVRTLRPGQPHTSLLVHRTPRAEVSGWGSATLLNRCDGEGGQRVVRARYGRSRYGRANFG